MGQVVASTVKQDILNEIVNLERYPLHALESMAGQAMVDEARRQLVEQGLASFPGLLRTSAIDSAVAAIEPLVDCAFATDDAHNAYQLPDEPSLPSSHVRNAKMRTRVASVAYDELRGPARTVYDFLPPLVNAVVGKELYKLADPLGAATINVFRAEWEHAWHYDEAEFTTTLSLMQAERGGDFEFTRPLRSEQSDLATEATAAVVNAHSEYSVEPHLCFRNASVPQIYVAPFEPGT